MRLLSRFPRVRDPRTCQFLQPVRPGISQVFAVVLLAFSGSMALFEQVTAGAHEHGVTTQTSSIARKLSQPIAEPAPPPAAPQAFPAPVPPVLPVVTVPSALTFYDCVDQGFCGAMYNGEPVYE